MNTIFHPETGAEHREFSPGYFVSREGVVLSKRGKGKRLKQIKAVPNEKGYLRFAATDDSGRTRMTAIHRAVLLAWVGPRPFPNAEARHLNGNRLDNRDTNLIWGTCTENFEDKVLHGTVARGERHGSAKLTETEAAEIIQAATFSRRGTGRMLTNRRELASRFGISASQVALIATGKAWSHLASAVSPSLSSGGNQA